jgi:hypothetical protein
MARDLTLAASMLMHPSEYTDDQRGAMARRLRSEDGELQALCVDVMRYLDHCGLAYPTELRNRLKRYAG